MTNKHEQLLMLLREVNSTFGRCVKEILIKYDLPFPLIMTARHISNQPGITISELSRRTGIAKSHISNMIRALGDRGWVIKKEDPCDQRLVRLYLTEPGIETLGAIRADVRRHLGAMVAEMPEEEVGTLISGLEDLKDVLSRASEKMTRDRDR